MEATSKIADNFDQASTGAHKAIDKVSGAARPAVDRMASGAHQAVDRIADVATQAAETLSAKSDQLKDVQAKLLGQTRSYVSAHPIATLGIAVAAGFLLSRLLSSSR
ncbi:MAG TPA: hypothetical protein VFW00_03495 [Rhodocyclaceae bacterium]|nr:hypothetical protein [Rhodocyclaceae bacterium]